jgi:hypothetical protein
MGHFNAGWPWQRDYLAARRHEFAPAELLAVRLQVDAANGDEFARVYEIRCYA